MRKFLRHLGVVCLLVGVVVGAGVAWSHFGQFSLPGEVRGNMAPVGSLSPGGKLPRGLKLPKHPGPGTQVLRGKNGKIIIINKGNFGSMDLGLNSMFQRVNWPYAERTVVIEGAVIIGVVILDAGRRRLRRARRRRRLRALDAESADRGNPGPRPLTRRTG